MLDINLTTVAEITSAISHYNDLCIHFSQLDPTQRTTLEEYHKKMLTFSKDGKYVDQMYATYWRNVNFYVVVQHWGSTSGGWGGMGGSAMTDSYTIVIENIWTGAIFVYYNGRLAYVASNNEALSEYRDKNFQFLPPLYDTKDLDIIYKSTR
jgi:hypothetical protein